MGDITRDYLEMFIRQTKKRIEEIRSKDITIKGLPMRLVYELDMCLADLDRASAKLAELENLK